MKYLLEHIWKFVKQVSKRVTKMIQQPKEANNVVNVPSSQESQASQHKKLKRKRKSFKSFLKDESHSRKMKKRQLRKTRRSSPAPLNINQETSDFEMSIESQNFETEQYKQHFTNEVKSAFMQMSPSCSALFEDKNGLQISVIAAEQKPADQFLNKEVDSDEELLQLICGEQAEIDVRAIVKRERRKRKNSKQWWQKIVQGAAPQVKVITIIDLTIDEDCPKIFQVPLALMG